MIIIPANTLSTGAYEVANSCRFNSGSSDNLNRTTETPTNADKATFSFWVKRCTLGTEQSFFSERRDHNNLSNILFDTSDRLWIYSYNSGTEYIFLVTNRRFRDVGAWYHIFCVFDTSQGTAANRVKIYINGVQETSFDTSGSGSVYPAEDQNLAFNETGLTLRISNLNSDQYLDCYLAEVAYVDGVAHAVTDFGEFDEDSPTIWKPIDVSGLTFGTNGFYLDFENSAALGDDVSGNGNDFTVNNLTATDQTTDTCTNNFATLNPLMNNLNNLPTLSEGNLEVLAVSGSTWSVTPSTIGLPKKGKWVFEVEAVSGTSGNRSAFAGWINPAVSNPLANGSILWRNIASTNSILSNDSAATGSFSATTWGTNGHIIGMYIDMDNSKMYFTHNGTVQNSGTGIDFQGTFDDDTFILPVVMVINTDKLSVNFGNPAANFAIASGNSDPNGYGNFEYSTTITGDGSSKSFYALCTKNLAEFG